MHRPLLLSALLVLAGMASVQPAAANLPACMDGYDNDGDGWVDWTNDPGCSATQDNDERGCSLDLPEECPEELMPCPGMLPPMFLAAERTESGVLLFWQHPLTGPPLSYVISRIDVDEMSQGTLTVPDPPLFAASVVADLADLGDPVVSVSVHPPQRPLPLTVPMAAMPFVEAVGAVSGDYTQFLDQTADLDGRYIYFVQAAGFACRSAPSSPVFYNTIIPNVEDCWYIQPNPLYYHPWPPSTDCIEI